MKLRALRSLILLSLLLLGAGRSRAEVREPFPLWPNGAPGALGTGTNDVPTLTPYLPEPGKATGGAMVICPGGGYGGLAMHEGPDYALFLNRQGITCFVLKYRLGSHGYRHPAMLNDVNRALRLVRSRAAEFGVDVQRVGVMGSSAGGHLASTAVTHWDEGKADAADPVDRFSSRPDLGILCYPVITMGSFTHAGSRRNLLGDNPPAELLEFLSSEKQVNARTPACFVWHTQDDPVVSVENAMAFAGALQKAGVSCDLHVYQKGPHGIGLGAKPPEFAGAHPWTTDLVFWLRQRGWIR